MRVQFKRFSLLPPDHITDLYSYIYPLVLNTGHLYKLLLWNWFVSSRKPTIKPNIYFIPAVYTVCE